jgi:hypothetical protein
VKARPPRAARQATTGRSTTVKYMLIIYGNQELWNSIDPEEFGKEIAEFDAFNKKYYDSGELLGAYGVADAAITKLVRVSDGQPAVTDGPSTWRPRSTWPAGGCSTSTARRGRWRSRRKCRRRSSGRWRSGRSCTRPPARPVSTWASSEP